MGSTVLVAGSVGLALGLFAGWWLGTRELDAPSGAADELVPASAPVGTAERRGSPEELGASPRLIPGEPSSTAAGRARGGARSGVLGPDGRVQSVPSALPELFAEALRARHAAQAEGSALAEEEVAARVADLPDQINGLVDAALYRAGWRAGQLRTHTLLKDPVELVLQVAALNHGSVGLLQPTPEGQGPIDFGHPPASWSPVHLTQGGILPAGRVLLVEEIALRLIPAPGTGGSCKLASADGDLVRVGTCIGPHRSLFRGRLIIDEGREDSLRLIVQSGGAEAILRGRLIERASRPRGAPPLTLVENEGGGFLGSEEVLLQMLAVHQGGNPCILDLSGQSNGYVRDARAAPVWLDASAGSPQGDGRYHARGTGTIPPGKVYEVTRVDYRGWVTRAQGSHSRLAVVAGGSLLTSDKSTESEFQGVWTGSHIVRPGDESSVKISASYYACVEARIEGRLVDASAVGPDGKITR